MLLKTIFRSYLNIDKCNLILYCRKRGKKSLFFDVIINFAVGRFEKSPAKYIL